MRPIMQSIEIGKSRHIDMLTNLDGSNGYTIKSIVQVYDGKLRRFVYYEMRNSSEIRLDVFTKRTKDPLFKECVVIVNIAYLGSTYWFTTN